MRDGKPTYEELQQRLRAAEDIIEALQGQQVDAIIGKSAVALLQLQEVKEELRRSEEWRSLAMEAGGVGLWEYNMDADEVSGSKRTHQLFAIDPDPDPDAAKSIRQVWKRIHPEDRPMIQAIAKTALKPSNDPVFQIDFRVLRPDKKEIWLATRGKTTFEETDQGPMPVRVRGAIIDVTEQKRAEKDLMELNKTLECRVKERTAEAEQRAIQLRNLARELSRTEEQEHQRFADILHEDLQQLLTALRFRFELLTSTAALKEKDPVQVKTIVELIDECNAKARSLSHDLSPPVLRSSNLVSALKWLCGDVKEKYEQEVTLDADESLVSLSLSFVIYRSIRELLFNSHKHSGAGAAHILARRDGDDIVIRVSDQGKGIVISGMERQREKSAGLGLFAIEERIRFLGGEVEIDSAPGEGFSVTMRIPDEVPVHD